jgi:hypothetical protein
MTGYVWVTSECFGCHRLMVYNPVHVPSIRINGQREPVCLDCVHRVNPQRVKNGLAPIIPHRDAYSPAREDEL